MELSGLDVAVLRGCDPRVPQTVLRLAHGSGMEVELVALMLERLWHRRLVTDDGGRGLRTRWSRTAAGDVALEWAV